MDLNEAKQKILDAGFVKNYDVDSGWFFLSSNRRISLYLTCKGVICWVDEDNDLWISFERTVELAPELLFHLDLEIYSLRIPLG